MRNNRSGTSGTCLRVGLRGAKPRGFEVRDKPAWIICDDGVDACPDESRPVTRLVGGPAHHLNTGLVRGGNSALGNQPVIGTDNSRAGAASQRDEIAGTKLVKD